MVLQGFLISNGQPFRYEGLDGTVERVWPRLDTYGLSQPDPKMDGVRVRLPREVTDCVLDHLQVAYLKNHEFGKCLLLMLVDRSYQRRMFRRWIDPAGRPCITGHTVCFSRPLGKFFYFSMVLFDYAFDADVELPRGLFDSDEEDTDEEFEMEREFPTDTAVPVVTVAHPYSFSVDGVIKPHHLVAPRQKSTGGSDWMMLFNVRPDDNVSFPEFEEEGVVAWTGRRTCDCMVLDATCHRGIYWARRVLQPFLIIRIDTEMGYGSTEWKVQRHHWERFARLVKVAFDGADLFMQDGKGRCERVLM